MATVGGGWGVGGAAWVIVKDRARPTVHKNGTLNLIRVGGWTDRGGGKFDVTLQLCSNVNSRNRASLVVRCHAARTAALIVWPPGVCAAAAAAAATLAARRVPIERAPRCPRSVQRARCVVPRRRRRVLLLASANTANAKGSSREPAMRAWLTDDLGALRLSIGRGAITMPTYTRLSTQRIPAI